MECAYGLSFSIHLNMHVAVKMSKGKEGVRKHKFSTYFGNPSQICCAKAVAVHSRVTALPADRYRMQILFCMLLTTGHIMCKLYSTCCEQLHTYYMITFKLHSTYCEQLDITCKLYTVNVINTSRTAL